MNHKELGTYVTHIYVYDTIAKTFSGYLYFKAYRDGVWSDTNQIKISLSKLPAPVITQEKNTLYIKPASTATCEIWYTIDGTTPVPGQSICLSGDSITLSKDVTIKAVEAYKGKRTSSVTSFEAKVQKLAQPEVTLEKDSTGVDIYWKPVTGAKGYYVYRKLDGGTYKKIASLSGASKNNYYDCNVQFGETYVYAVKAYNATEVSGYKGVEILYGLDTPKVTLTSTSDSIKVKWQVVPLATGYYVYRKELGGTYKKLASITDANKVSYTDKKFEYGKEYVYTVKAIRGTQASKVVGVQIKAPMKSMAVQVSIEDGRAILNWEQVAEATGYKVYRKEADGKYTTLVDIYGNDQVRYVDKNIELGSTYTYAVRARYGATLGDFIPTTITISLPKMTATVKRITTGVKISWTAVPQVDGYKVYRIEDGKSTLLSNTTDSSLVSYIDKNVTVGKTYTYYVKSYKGTLNSSYEKVSIQVK